MLCPPCEAPPERGLGEGADRMPRIGTFADENLSASDRNFLRSLQMQALQYFVDNQTVAGLILDRQRNRSTPRTTGLCSLAATGMGCVALALAARPEYDLLSPGVAARRVGVALRTCLNDVPADHGVLPHFIESDTLAVRGADVCSTVETAWLVAGALWAAASLRDAELEHLATQLYDRIDWAYWSQDDGLIRHGKDCFGRFLGCAWDRLNGETAFMYALAAGADHSRCNPEPAWKALQPFHGTVAGLRFASADLGLFVFQYGLDLLDLSSWHLPGSLDLWAEAAVATEANLLACRAAADRYKTYRRFWGLSAGDGPAHGAESDIYRDYSPLGLIDGTAHLTATLASVAHRPGDVLDQLRAADRDGRLGARGRYGFSNVNLDVGWVGTDMVGIDAGAAVLALDNVLCGDRVRSIFHKLPCIERAVCRVGFVPRLPIRRAA
jgi:hypothetical protein